MLESQELAPVAAHLVGDDDRLSFLPNAFGERLMMRGESLVYAWMDSLCEDYNGGFWNFYTLTNGGFYMAPDAYDRMRLQVHGNGFEGDLSADAAGIVATLFAVSQLAAMAQGTAEGDQLVERYFALRDFASGHAEAALIFRAID